MGCARWAVMGSDEIAALIGANTEQNVAIRSDITELRESITHLSGVVEHGFLRAHEAINANGDAIDELNGHVLGVKGDDDRPGLRTEVKALEARQAGDEEREENRVRDMRWVKRIIGALGALTMAVGLPTAGWVASQAWGDHEAIAQHGQEIALVKQRVEQLETGTERTLEAILEAVSDGR